MTNDSKRPTLKPYRGGRGRFKKALDALEQLESIEKVQAALRKTKRPDKIQSAKKSKQRFKNAYRNSRHTEDFIDDFS